MRALRLAARTLWRTPFVTVAAVLSLSLGIGANTAIFSMFDQLLRRPLPVPEPSQLVNLVAPGPKPGSTSCNDAGPCEHVFSYPMFRDLERAQTVFTGLAAHVLFGASITAQERTVSAPGELVSGAYFSVLDVQPQLGRLISPDDDRVVGGGAVAVLSHAFWRDYFNASTAAVGQPITVNGAVLEVIGVAPESFKGTTASARPAIYVPITLRDRLLPSPAPGPPVFENRRSYWAYLFARLNPAVTIEQAQTALSTPYRSILNDVEAPLQAGMSDDTLARFRSKPLLLEPGAQGQSTLNREAGPPLTLLLGATALVLLIACANIANLLLARSAARANEMAVRASLGASRLQLAVQLMTESAVLAGLGGIGGLLVARWTLGAITAALPGDIPPDLIVTAIDGPAFLFAAGTALGTGFLFGLFPAIHATRPDLVSALKAHSGQPSGAKAAARFRWALATAQMALSTLLLVAAGLFIRSLVNVSRVDLGLDPERVVTFEVSPVRSGYSNERSRELFGRLEEELRALPGVTGVTAATVPVLGGDNWRQGVSVQGFVAGPDTDISSSFNRVGPGFFSTLGIPLLAGREFTAADAEGTPRVAIVNEAFLRKFNLGRDAVGKRIGERSQAAESQLDIEIVGIVRDAKYSEVKEEVPPVYVRPYRQDRTGNLTFYVRAAANPDQVMRAIPRLVATLDPNLPVEDMTTLPQQVRDNVFIDRFLSVLSTSFAVLATLLAAIGLYGVLAYSVEQRRREIGLRMALGAAPGAVLAMILRQVGVMAAVGGAVGLVAAIWLGRATESLLFGLPGTDPFVLAGATLSLGVVALLAGAVPARRAATVDPMVALRYD
jgi:predicted permease